MSCDKLLRSVMLINSLMGVRNFPPLDRFLTRYFSFVLMNLFQLQTTIMHKLNLI